MRGAKAGIDRYFERYYRKGPRRRPIRIEFCEADVLDAFDDWRRAVGVAGAPGGDNGEAPARKPSLASHIERAIARLAHTRGPGLPATALHRHIDEIIRELEGLTESARRARGEVRERMIGR